MMFRKKYKYIFGILPVILLFRYDLILYGEKREESMGEIFLSHMFGGSYSLDEIDISLSVFGLIGIVFMGLLFADYIVQDFFNNEVYIFSRYTNRKRWFTNKIAGVFGYSLLGIFLNLLPYIVFGLRETGQKTGSRDWQLILCTYIMLVLFVYFNIICINIGVMKYGTTIGFIIFYSVLIISTILTLFIQKLPNQQVAMVLHRLNPMSNIFVSWNFSSFYVRWGMMYYLVLCIVSTLFMWCKARKYEIGINVRMDT